MNGCDRIRPWIARSVDGELRPDEALRLARHLATCTACRIVLARESRLAAILEGVDDACNVDESFFEGVMASLPEFPGRPVGAVGGREARWRRGLRLAAWGSVLAAGGGLAARVLPSLRMDVATPAMPRFSPAETETLITLIGSAAQWIRMTAQSVAWAGSPGSLSAGSVSALSLGMAVAGALTLLAVSGALAWVSRYGRAARP